MELYLASLTGAVIVALFVAQVATRRFDPFAPVWLFLLGFAQIYVVQAISYHEYAIRVRGADLVPQPTARALGALLWFLLVSYGGFGRLWAARLPPPPRAWSPGLIVGIAPPMIAWGLACAGLVLTGAAD